MIKFDGWSYETCYTTRNKIETFVYIYFIIIVSLHQFIYNSWDREQIQQLMLANTENKIFQLTIISKKYCRHLC